MAKSHSIAQAKYDSTHCKYYTLKMNLATDSDIIARLETVESKQGYIKQLIREDIARTCSDSVPKWYNDPEVIKLSKTIEKIGIDKIKKLLPTVRQSVPKADEE